MSFDSTLSTLNSTKVESKGRKKELVEFQIMKKTSQNC